MTGLPVLHVITDDAILGRQDFEPVAVALLEEHGRSLSLHIRGPGTGGRAIHRLADRLAGAAEDAGGLLMVNDRADAALAAGAGGVQLGARSLPLGAVRRLRADWVLGASVHDADEAEAAARDGADFLLLGTIWPTASHPGRGGSGVRGITVVRDRLEAAGLRVPVVAIGGVTPERVAPARAAGAAGVAAIRGVWQHRDPVAAAGTYIAAWENGA